MVHALSNPYELTVSGITCKCSPYGQGHYIAGYDVTNLGINADMFRKELARLYYVSESVAKNGELEHIKVDGPRPVQSLPIMPEEKKDEQQKRNTHQEIPQRASHQGSGEKGIDSKESKEGNIQGQKIG